MWQKAEIGEIKFIDASARSTPVDQAPHVLQLVSSYIDNSRPVRVLGQISGKEQLDSAQPSPMHAAGHVMYENGLHVSIAFGTGVGTMASDNQACIAINAFLSLERKGLYIGDLVVGNARHERVATKAVPLTMVSRILKHKEISPKQPLIGLMMRAKYIRRISSNRLLSSTCFSERTTAV